ncbi:hypothetical protein FLJC2902T_32450 [Flavobacterium limnosediminis JC2902]|uniref:Uncharacterized protein n=1 Tax=Flavobacterium limnosediminis JC2902 TaxID=1341181 RepID=V6S839_9FLAO|nr:hypothetical protein [Flavobacterium limnosediminis]ESU22806.1 hypothetical protein FLJC2902T_32450 [Flavobacterium limnosediminis JC2902]
MEPITKRMIKTFFISGLIYAGLMAGDDYIGGNGFRLWRFILHASVFGLLMAFLFRYNFKKNESSKEDKN